MYSGLIAAFVVSLILTVIIVAIGSRGPWGTAWTFFLVLFLALWMVSIYIREVEPMYMGVAWTPIVIAGILLAFLLTAAIPDANTWRDESLRSNIKKVNDEGDVQKTAVGKFFWILILLMIAAIIIGMTNPQPAL